MCRWHIAATSSKTGRNFDFSPKAKNAPSPFGSTREAQKRNPMGRAFSPKAKMHRVPSDLPVNIKPLPKPSAALVLVASSGYPGAPAARLNTHRTYPSALFSCGRLFVSLKKHTAKCAFSDRHSFPNVSQVGTRFTLRKPAFWSDQTCRRFESSVLLRFAAGFPRR